MTMQQNIIAQCSRFPLIPVLAFDDTKRALEICDALLRGGVAVLEITYRTAAAAEVIAAVADAYAGTHPNAVIAAGSVRAPAQLQSAKDAGAAFAVCPGATPTLLDAGILPLLPAAATATEIMLLAERGYDFLKFFPAVAAGGVKALASFHGPLADIKFCPTGGVNADNAASFLALPNVICAGCSYLVQDGDDAEAVHKKTTAAAQLLREHQQ